MADNSLINFGDLGKPATALIEKISDAITGIAKPFQTVRVARAEAQAALIGAQSQLEVEELQRRALGRFVQEESQRQLNIEGITQKAIPLLTDDSQSSEIPNDWITNFFDKSRIISDEEMQNLWAHVLAGEANSPGAFSRKTVNLIADLDRNDAELFTHLCSFAPLKYQPLVLDSQAEIYTLNKVNFSSINHLESLGLVHVENFAGFQHTGLDKKVLLQYFDESIELTFSQDKDNKLSAGKVMFTAAGLQLAGICQPKPVVGFTDYLAGKWREQGIEVVVNR